MSKQGMQLSIESLVVIILGIILLGGGIFFIQTIIGQAERILPDVTGDQEARLAANIASGETIVLLNNNQRGRYGEYVIPVGFINRLQEHDFYLNVTLRQHINREGDVTPGVDVEVPAPLYDDSTITLQAGEQVTNIPFLINIPRGSPRGTYEYRVEIQYNETSNGFSVYESPRIARITIE